MNPSARRSVGFSNLTLGSNQRMEFLGDTVLQLITSEYLYKHFPEHHEGHLSLLRSSIVNNRTQAVVCDDVGIPEFAAVANPNRKTVDLKVMPKTCRYICSAHCNLIKFVKMGYCF